MQGSRCDVARSHQLGGPEPNRRQQAGLHFVFDQAALSSQRTELAPTFASPRRGRGVICSSDSAGCGTCLAWVVTRMYLASTGPLLPAPRLQAHIRRGPSCDIQL
jgi:hypothetical protein